MFDEIQIKTQDFSTLTPIRFSFESGEILAKQLKIVNWKLESSPNEESMQNVARVVVETNGSKYGVKSMQIQNLRDGESIKFETDESLPSDSKISYIIRAYDVFGNEMVLENNKGETRTCKQTPKVKIKVVTNKVSDVQLQIQLTNPDHVDLEDYRLTATDTSGNLVWQGEIPDSNISFNNLDAGKVLNLRITASMDVEDGRGMQEDVLLADTQIVTVPLSSLGNIGALLNIIEVKADSVSFRYKVDTMRTNPMILELMTQMSLSITDASGQVISKELTPEQLAEIKAGNEIQLEFDNLNSRTIHQFSVSTVLKHGTSFYTDFKTNLSTRNFQTLRRSTWIEMRGLDMKEDTFTFEARAIDLDGAVTDGYVGMRVYGPSGVVVDVLVIDTVSDPEQGGWTSYTYTIPSESDWNSAFRFEFYAVEYNEGYNAITRKTNHIIDTVVLATPTSVAGSLGLASIESSSAGEEQRLVNFQYTVYDKGGNVKDKAYYFTVYSDDEQIGTYEYSMGEGVSYISEKEQAFFLDLELGREYRVELWVENTGSAITTRQVLGEVRFDTLYNVKPIRTPQELYDVANDPDAHYIVLNDLDLNAVRGKIDVAFTGQINFMGHTVKFSVDEERQYLFKTTGARCKAQCWKFPLSMPRRWMSRRGAAAPRGLCIPTAARFKTSWPILTARRSWQTTASGELSIKIPRRAF